MIIFTVQDTKTNTSVPSAQKKSVRMKHSLQYGDEVYQQNSKRLENH